MQFLDAFDNGRLGTLVLGTAQLGMPYGVANRTSPPGERGASEMLAAAWDAGIRVIDTAQTYGDSERLIGGYLAAHPNRHFHVITKLATVEPNRAAIVQSAQRSRNVLGRSIASLMLHDASAVESWSLGLQAGLEDCLELGIAESIGASLYTPDQFRAAMAIPAIRVIQAPFNALDRRLLKAGLLERATDAGRVVVLRSVFLQGLLILRSGEVPRRLAFAEPDLERWRDLCTRYDEGLASAALRYARRAAPRALIAIGCDTVEQITANAQLVADCDLPDSLLRDLEALPTPPEHVINPSLWPRE